MEAGQQSVWTIKNKCHSDWNERVRQTEGFNIHTSREGGREQAESSHCNGYVNNLNPFVCNTIQLIAIIPSGTQPQLIYSETVFIANIANCRTSRIRYRWNYENIIVLQLITDQWNPYTLEDNHYLSIHTTLHFSPCTTVPTIYCELDLLLLRTFWPVVSLSELSVYCLAWPVS